MFMRTGRIRLFAAVLTTTSAALTIGGCSGPDPVIPDSLPVAPAKFGAGTINTTTVEGTTVLLFTPNRFGADPSEFVVQEPIGQVTSKDSQAGKINAAADLLKLIGVDAHIAAKVAERSSINATSVSKRDVDGGALVRLIDAARIRCDVLDALKRTDAKIIVADYVVTGLVFDVGNDLDVNGGIGGSDADADVRAKLEAAAKAPQTSPVRVTASGGANKVFHLESNTPVCTNTDPVPCSSFAQSIHLDVDAALRKQLAALEASHQADQQALATMETQLGERDTQIAALAHWQRRVNAVFNRNIIDYRQKTQRQFNDAKGATLIELNSLFPNVKSRNDEIVAGIYANDKPPLASR